jgi:hypothetical protein
MTWYAAGRKDSQGWLVGRQGQDIEAERLR